MFRAILLFLCGVALVTTSLHAWFNGNYSAWWTPIGPFIAGSILCALAGALYELDRKMRG